jgi:hypothetical protein
MNIQHWSSQHTIMHFILQEQEYFTNVMSGSIRALVALFESQLLATPLDGLTKLALSNNWQRDEHQPSYVAAVVEVMATFTHLVRRLVSKSNFRYVCDKVVTAFVSRYLRCLHQCRPLPQECVQGLLVDCELFSAALRALHWIRPGLILQDGQLDTAALEMLQNVTPPSLERFVKREMQRVEAIVRLVLLPAGSLVDHFCTELSSASAAELQQVMDLKGVVKAHQETILDQLQRRRNNKSGPVKEAVY